ncbi:5'/3'-nucleotidase SurE [Kitasatospora sp. NBC_00374]|uniref:5'/3'-nucleotidase SurE n=1 Tax=Kitasatospora sp. NBC_00374 TaxID=2975964 RepID=UPI0032454E0E
MRRSRALPMAAALLCTPALAGALPAAATDRPAPTSPLRILLSNDDGYNAPGIRAVYDRLTAAGYEVTIVAPLRNNSGAGTKINSAPTVTVQHPEEHVWAVDGTPGDSVLFGLYQVFKDKAPDLVISGTNFGPNYAVLANHSGTVGAAVAALENGVPAIAVSTDAAAGNPQATLNAMRPTADFTAKLVDRLKEKSRSGRLLPEGVGLNINHPVVGADGTGTAKGVAVTTQDSQRVLTPSYTPATGDTWNVSVAFGLKAPAPGSDLEALQAGRIAVSPMAADWNAGPAAAAKAAAAVAGLRP